MLLRGYICLTGLSLGIKRVEALLKAFVSTFAGIDCTSHQMLKIRVVAMDPENQVSSDEVKNLRTSKEIESHLRWLDTFTSAALGILAVASGIYTYLGVSSLLEDNGAINFLAAMSYSIAVSVGIFVFWSYMMRLLPAMRSFISMLGFTLAMIVGSLSIVAMSSWLNAAALAGSAAPEEGVNLNEKSTSVGGKHFSSSQVIKVK